MCNIFFFPHVWVLGRERWTVSGSSIQTVRPRCSVQCPTPGRWNGMHYSCLQGAGFEVSVCIMKAERLGIVMLYGSLVIFLSLSVCFSLYVFLSVTISFILFYSILSFLWHFCPRSPPAHAQDTLIHTNTFSSCCIGLLCPCFHCRALWLIETGAVKRPHTRSQS